MTNNRSRLPGFPPGTVCSRERISPFAHWVFLRSRPMRSQRPVGNEKTCIYNRLPVPGYSSLKREGASGMLPSSRSEKASPPGAQGDTRNGDPHV